jgi:hypothetical protein
MATFYFLEVSLFIFDEISMIDLLKQYEICELAEKEVGSSN